MLHDLIMTILTVNTLILVLACVHFWRTRHEPDRRTPRPAPSPWCATRKEGKS